MCNHKRIYASSTVNYYKRNMIFKHLPSFLKYTLPLCGCMIIGIGTYLMSREDTMYLKNANYEYMNNIYAMYPTQNADIVMLGDSHTHALDWSELYNNPAMVNRGIRGDIIPGFIARLPEIEKLKPKIVCIMGGINDLYAHYSVVEIIEHYRVLIRKVKNDKRIIIVQSTLPVCETYSEAEVINKKVYQLNQKLKNVCQKEGIMYCDIYSAISQNGYLPLEYSIDGLHLNAQGYKQWHQVLTPILEKNN